MNKRHYEHTLPNIRGSLSNTYVSPIHRFMYQEKLTFVFYTGMGFTRNVSRLR